MLINLTCFRCLKMPSMTGKISVMPNQIWLQQPWQRKFPKTYNSLMISASTTIALFRIEIIRILIKSCSSDTTVSACRHYYETGSSSSLGLYNRSRRIHRSLVQTIRPRSSYYPIQTIWSKTS